MSQPMALQANTVATQTAPSNPATTNSTPPAFSGGVQAKPTDSFGRVLQDRMSPQTAEPADQKASAQSDGQQFSGAKRAVATDEPATKPTTSGNTLPDDSATVVAQNADDDGHESDLDTITVVGVAADVIGMAALSSIEAANSAMTAAMTPASALAALAAGSAPGRPITAAPATTVTATLVGATPGAQSSKAENASGGSPTALQAAGTGAVAPTAANIPVATTTIATTTTSTTAQIAAAAAVVVVAAGGKDVGSTATKSPGLPQTTAVSVAAGQQAKLQTAAGQDTTQLPRVLSQTPLLQSTPSLATGSQPTGPQAAGSVGQAVPVQGQAGAITLDSVVGPNSDAKNALQQLAAGMRAVAQRLVSTPNTHLTGADRIGTAVVDGSGAVPVLLSNASAAALTPLATTTVATVFTMPVGVQPGDPRWAQAFTDRVVWLVQGNVQAANIRLNPPELGQLDIRISLQNDQASILIASPHQTVRHALESTLLQLRQQFDNMGFVDVQAQVTDQQPRQRDQAYYTAPDSAASESADGSLLQPLTAVAARVPQGLLDLYI